jgi:L-iditol 2-dehydrogenase
MLADGIVRIIERELPDPGPGEVILRMDALGVCSSDVHIWCGRKPASPGVLGHEGAGTVVAVGPAVGWREADEVVVNPLLNCGSCIHCRSGDGHICQDRQIVGYNGRGIFGDRVLLPARALFRPPERLPARHRVLVEPFACVVHAQSRLPGALARTMVVLGAGPMGVMHVTLAKLHGVEQVWLVDASPGKLALAQRRGIPADAWVAASDAEARIAQLSAGRGADVAVIANSMRSGHELACRLCADEGAVLAFASILDAPGPIDVKGAAIDTDDLHRREACVRIEGPGGAAWIAGAIGFRPADFGHAASLLADMVDAERFITREITLDQVPELLPDAWTQELKILVHPAAKRQVGYIGENHGHHS